MFAAALVSWAGLADARAEGAPMAFRVARLDSPECSGRCPEVIVADGVIERDTPDAFLEFARHAALSPRLRALVFLNSPGGNVVASMELGSVFRRLRMGALVAGFATAGGVSGPTVGLCASACVYALMGATRRVAPPSSVVALHRMSVTESDASGQAPSRRFADPRLVGVLARYARRMGVDPHLVVVAESLPPDKMRPLSRREIRRWRLATAGF